jgi:hypothetical protein
MAAPSQTGFGHQSPQSSLPPLSQKQINVGTWGAGGNTLTIQDEYIHANSVVLAFVTGTGAQAQGTWSYLTTQGQCVITSSDSESSSLPVAYIIL